jgi:hypothetical protein
LNRFNGFPPPCKPLKRLRNVGGFFITGLKPLC